MMNFPIYLVSLKGDVERRNTLKERFYKYYNSFIHVEAVDGRELCAREYYTKIIEFYRQTNKIISPAELGCTLSHIKVLKNFLESGEPYALVLEDDVIGNDDDLERIQSTVEMLNKRNDFLFFCGMYRTPYMKYQVGSKLHASYYVVHKFSYNYLYGTFSYVITRNIAKKILSKHERCLLRADDWGRLLSEEKQGSVYFENIIRHPEIMDNSHIESERVLSKAIKVRMFLSIPGLSSILKRGYAELVTFILSRKHYQRLK